MRRWLSGSWGRASALPVIVMFLFLATGAAQDRQDPQAILWRNGPVNVSAGGTSWWLANDSLVVTWDVSAGIRVSSVYDRVGGRTGTKPGDAFVIETPDGRAIRSTECRAQGRPSVEDVTGTPPGIRMSASFVCPDSTRPVTWRAELRPGDDIVRQAVELKPGEGLVRVSDVGYPASSTRAAPPAEVRVVAGPYLQVAGASAMTVMWVTDGPATGWVEYGPPGGPVQRAVPVEDGLVRAGGRIQSVLLRGLMPGALYAYRVATRPILSYGPYKVEYGQTIWSEGKEFRTSSPRGQSFSFLVMNDLHENVDIMRAHAARAALSPYDLVFLNGDSLSHLEDDTQIVERCLRPAGELFAGRAPLVVVRGNHETRGKHARVLKSYLALPGDRYYFALTHGSVRFVVLDTGEDKEDSHWAYSGLTNFEAYRAEQAEWLKAEVRSQAFRDATYRIVVAHMPFFGNERTRVSGAGPTSCREHFGAILNEAGIDLHIAGHTHRADWVEPTAGANRFPIVVGGGSAAGSNTLTRVDVSAEGLTITQTTDEGKEILKRTVPRRR